MPGIVGHILQILIGSALARYLPVKARAIDGAKVQAKGTATAQRSTTQKAAAFDLTSGGDCWLGCLHISRQRIVILRTQKGESQAGT